MKNPLTPAGIEPATFRIVAQHLNHCRCDYELWYNRETILAWKRQQMHYQRNNQEHFSNQRCQRKATSIVW
jgi:hypothetical protein